MLCSLTYFSERSFGCPDNEVVKIVEDSAQRNARKNLTGFLVADHHFFLQTLEGDRAALSTLFDIIQADYRHSDVVLASFREIDKRSFAQWGMAHVGDANLIKAAAAPILNGKSLSPTTMPAADLQALLARACNLTQSIAASR